jgi:hypothetical protein
MTGFIGTVIGVTQAASGQRGTSNRPGTRCYNRDFEGLIRPAPAAASS